MLSPPPPKAKTPAPGAPPSGLSAIAVGALVLALVPCCPLTALCGAFLGLFALRRIQRSGGRLRGARIAMSATIVGIVASFAWMYVFDRFAVNQIDAQESAVAEVVAGFVSAAQAGRADDALSLWSEEATPLTAEEVTAFGAEVTRRYGDVERFAVLSTARSGTFLAPEVEVAGIFRTAGDSPIGSARLRMVFGGGLTPAFRPTQITIEDAVRGDLVLGGE